MAERNGSDLTGVAPGLLVDDPDFRRGIGARAVPAILEEEMTAHLGAARYERGEARRGYRNGAKSRTLTTRVGTLQLRVPQDRDGTFSTEVFARDQRSEQALVTTLMEMSGQGVSTRKVTAITEDNHGGTVWDRLLQIAGVGLGGTPGPGVGGLADPTTDGGGLPVPGGRRPVRAGAHRWAGGHAGGAARRWGAG